MKSLLVWLKSMENHAHLFYHNASQVFSEEGELSQFLCRLAGDEKEHARLIQLAADYIDQVQVEIGQVAVNDEVKRQIEAPLKRYTELLTNGDLSREELLTAIIEIEYSELNTLFLHVFNTLKSFNKTFQQASSELETHKKNIISFYENLADSEKYLKIIKSLPNLWEKRVLVVEDNDMLRTFFREFLKKKAKVETSKNGTDALKKTRGKYYDVIITDIEMPEMNGIDFFKRTIESQPEMEKNFIFCSGYISEERKDFLSDHRVPFLAKPIPIGKLEALVDKRLGNI